MKGKAIRLVVAFVAMGACLALAQDKDDHHGKKHNHHMVSKRVSTPHKVTYVRHYRGGEQTITTYRSGSQHRSISVSSAASKARPYYHPKKKYSDAEWQRRIKEARDRRNHRKGSSSKKRWPVMKSPTHHRWPVVHTTTHRRWPVTTVHHKKHKKRHHDNGRHLGWYKGKGNPHRSGHWPNKSKHHDKGDDNDQGHKKGDRHHHGG